LAWVGLAEVYHGVAEVSSVACSTEAFKRIHHVHTCASIEAHHIAGNTFINVDITEATSETICAYACVIVGLVDTGSIVHARVTDAIIDHGLTELSSVAHITHTHVVIHQVHTLAVAAVDLSTVVNVNFTQPSLKPCCTITCEIIDQISTSSSILAHHTHTLIHILLTQDTSVPRVTLARETVDTVITRTIITINTHTIINVCLTELSSVALSTETRKISKKVATCASIPTGIILTFIYSKLAN